MRGRGPGNGRIERIESGGETVYRGVWSDAGGRRRRKVLSRNRRDAERALALAIRDRDLELAGLARETNQERLLSDVCAEYLRSVEATGRAAYIRSVRRSLETMQQAIGPIRVRDVYVTAVESHRQRRMRDGASVRTANVEVLALRTALKWAEQVGLVGVNPLTRLRPLKTNEANAVKRRRALTDDEIARFFAAAHEIDRDRASASTLALMPQLPMWKTLVTTGLRWGEACALTWADVGDDGFLTVRATTAKSKRGRVVPVSDQLLREIQALRRLQFRCTGHLPGKADQVFLTQRGRPWRKDANPRSLGALRAVLMRAGIDEVDALGRCVDVHALRGTAATAMLRRGVPVAHVSKILGHADVRMTMRHYQDLGAADLRTAIIGVDSLQKGRRAD